MPTNVTCQDVIERQKCLFLECLQIDASSFLWLSVDISGS